MLTINPPFSNPFYNFKCGEVYCEKEYNFNVVCSVCTASVLLDNFVAHFRMQHLTILAEDTINHNDLESRRRDKLAKDATLQDPIYVPIKKEQDDEIKIKVTNEIQLANNESITRENYELGQDSDENKTLLELIKEKRKKNKKHKEGKCNSRTTKCLNSDIRNDLSIIKVDLNVLSDNKNVHQESELDNFEIDSDQYKDETVDGKEEPDNSTVVEDKEQFICFKCDRTYKNKYGLRKHEYQVHSAEKIPRKYKTSSMEHKCEQCGKVCRSARELQTHVSRHDGIRCDECGKQFSWAGSLVQHKKRHSGIRDYKCRHCPKDFFTNQELINHSVWHTGLLTHICEVCGKKFRDGAVLKSHMRRHTGERPEKCNICGKAYYDRHDLNSHMVTHTDERPFKCDICNSTYQTRKALGIHKWIHNKERKYACRICNKKFAQPGGLKSHIRKAHNAADCMQKDCLSATKTTPEEDKTATITNLLTTTSNSVLLTGFMV